MAGYYYFFFSYARANYENAIWQKQGDRGNYIDEFFDTLCREVSDLTGRATNEVAYRDQNHLKVGEFWDQSLVEGLQKSRVLLSLISPHYLQNHNCGRELAFFDKRLEEHIKAAGSDAQSHRIVPLFWKNSVTCFQKSTPGIATFLRRCNFTQQGMPANYLTLGLSQICKLRNGNDYEQLCQSLAERIVELADNLEPLSALPEQGDFSDLESLYTQLEKEDNEDLILSSPSGANVVYAVGTRAEMESVDGVKIDTYREERENWSPFPESQGATVELLTQEGANLAGLPELRNHGLPRNPRRLIEIANERNSPVLIVLDRCALFLPHITTGMSDYDGFNSENCGLVTAGGREISDDRVKQVFKFKCIPSYLHHIWNVPENRDAYVESVASVLSGIKKQLMSNGLPGTRFIRGALPGLSTPSED
jgi:hypothetical protein